MPPKIETVTDPIKAKALASPTRLKILQEIANTPQSISQLARKLKITPVAVHYHTKKLSQAGFIRIAKTAKVNNNFTEKFYEATTPSYLVVLGGIESLRGPVPPKHAEKLVLGITADDIAKMFDMLGLTYQPKNKAQVEEAALQLLETAIYDAREVQREILRQSNLKLSGADHAKVEYGAMAVVPIVLDRLLGNRESLARLQSILELLHKKPAP